MRKLLIAGGDSNTDDNYVSDFHPELKCDWKKWPEILADKLDMDFINLGKSGQGQEYIYTSTLEEIHKHDVWDIGLVVVGWSTAPRRDYYDNNKWWATRWDTLGDSEYFIKRTLQFQYSLQSVCENLTIPYKQLSMLQPWHLPEGFACGAKGGSETEKWPEAKKSFIPEEKWIAKFMSETLYQKINDYNYIGWPIHKKIGGFCGFDFLEKEHRISERDWHPNEKGQEQLADMIFVNMMKHETLN